MKVAKRIDIRRKLIELGFVDLKEYCNSRKLDYKSVIYIFQGILDGSRSKKVKHTLEILKKDFGEEILKKYWRE